MIELFILLQLIQVLTQGANLINFYEDQKEVGVHTSISVYTNYFYDTSVIFSNLIITYREPFTGPT